MFDERTIFPLTQNRKRDRMFTMTAEARNAMQPGIQAYNTSARAGGSFRSSNKIQDYWQFLAERAILVLGSPRSGTSWLAKIFDSHPDILYRHEPDEVTRLNPSLPPGEQISVWLRERSLRVAAKRPHFHKDWRPGALSTGRHVIAAGIAAAQRLPTFRTLSARLPIPDLVVPTRRRSVRAALKLVNWDGLAAARTMSGVRCVFIVRHPCAQIASVMTGRASRQFAGQQNSSRSNDEHASDLDAMQRASAAGVDARTFRELPEAARLAWGWLAFNEPAVAGFKGQPNGQIVLYEQLCREPQAVSYDLFNFAGLSWSPQTAAFVNQSTSEDRGAGYFDVFRLSADVADKWRRIMSPADQALVRAVISCSALASLWPDLL